MAMRSCWIGLPVWALMTLPAWGGPALPTPSEGFLCCNLQAEGDWISDNTLRSSTSRLLPAGTPLKAVDYGRRHVKVQVAGTPMRLGNDYSRKLDLKTFAQRYIVEQDPAARMSAWPPAILEAVRNGHLLKGMSREQVAMSVGYPVADATPDLAQARWTFWAESDVSFDVDFDDQGLLTGVTGPDKALALVAPSLLTAERLEAATAGERYCAVNVYRPERQPVGSGGRKTYIYVDGENRGLLWAGETLCLSLSAGPHSIGIGVQPGWLLPVDLKGQLTVEVGADQPAAFLRYSQEFAGISVLGPSVVPKFRDDFYQINERRWRSRE